MKTRVGSLNFYHDGPLFGLDIGHSSLKVMQIEKDGSKKPKVLGYGLNGFAPNSIANGVIVKPDALAKSIYDLFENGLVGQIFTHRVACALPTTFTFSRPMKIPVLEDSEIKEAIHFEAEQYIPMPIDKLYLDYEISSRSAENIELLMVATPRNIVDSYLNFLEVLKLEPVAMEPAINASSRLFSMISTSAKSPVILIDFGSVSTDVAVFDNTVFVNNTVNSGAETMNDLIAKKLKITAKEALDIKNKAGIGPGEKQKQIIEAIDPVLDSLVKEVDKVMRYYSEHNEHKDRKIAQIITLGGGAIMPGLSEYLFDRLHIPTNLLKPWNNLDFGELSPPSNVDSSLYITVAGEAMLNPMEIFP